MFCGVDIGNTNVKISSQDNGKEFNTVITESVAEAIEHIHYLNAPRVAYSTTRSLSPNEQEMIQKEGWWQFTTRSKFPLQIKYKTPESLGTDRLAAVAGAASLFPREPLVVADAGTALTIEIIGGDGSYEGGNISPGIQMRFDAMHAYTSKLPLEKLEGYEERHFGDDTVKALRCGVSWGVINEIYGSALLAKEDYGCKMLIITGGGSPLILEGLRERMKGVMPVESVPSLVHIGLKELYEYNHEEKN